MNRATTVFVWLAAEWQPLRLEFTAALPDLLPNPPPHAAVVAETHDRTKRVGRVANWVVSHLEHVQRRAQRVQIGDSFTLGSIPAIGVTELLLDPDPAQVDQLYALGIWSRFVPRRRRWLMRITPYLNEEIVANAAAAGPFLSLQVAEWQGHRILLAATDLIAAEVIGRGMRAIAQPAGDTGENPWQSPMVQIAGERALGPTTGAGIQLRAITAGRVSPAVLANYRVVTERIGRLVDCRVDAEGAPD
jgi:hypothetical protein